MQLLVENAKIVTGLVPKDITGAAQTGDYVSLKNYGHATIIIKTGAVANGADAMAITLKQATAVAGTGEKALAFSKYWVSDASGDTFTQTTATSNTFNITGTDDNKIYVLEVDSADLDAANDFDCVRVDVGSPGANAVLLDCTYILTQPRFAGDGSSLPSSIVD